MLRKGSFICKTLSDTVSEAWAQTEEGRNMEQDGRENKHQNVIQ